MLAQAQMVYPVAAMLLLTVVVMVLMLRERVAEMKARQLSLKSMPSSSQMSAVLQNTRAADHYRNLFEMPVFFHVLCVAVLATGLVGPAMVAMAWLYVALRVAHAVVHLGRNRIRHRLRVFGASCAVLAAMWVTFVVQLSLRALP